MTSCYTKKRTNQNGRMEQSEVVGGLRGDAPVKPLAASESLTCAPAPEVVGPDLTSNWE